MLMDEWMDNVNKCMERQSDWCMIISRLCHVARFQKQSIYPSSITHSKKKKDFQTDTNILWFHLFSLGYQFSWINRAVVRIVVDTWVFVVLKLIHNFSCYTCLSWCTKFGGLIIQKKTKKLVNLYLYNKQ